MRVGRDHGRGDGRRRAAAVGVTSGRGVRGVRFRRVDWGVSDGTEFEFDDDGWRTSTSEQERFDGGFKEPTGGEYGSLERVSEARGVDCGR